MFAACQEEEIVVQESLPQQMEEVVGAKLVGSDLSLSVINSDESATRFAGGKVNAWDEKDLIGLGWVVRSNASALQNGADPNRDELFANHMFAWDGERFSSIGNIYEGWHFAYYPWSRMSKVGAKQFVVNPAQKALEEGQNAKSVRLSQALHISHRHFVSSADVEEDNTLKTSFAVQPATNLISVNTTPTGTFCADGELGKAFAEEGKEVKIENVVINLGQKVFAEKLNLEITYDGSTSPFPAWDKELTAEENAQVLRQALYSETNPLLAVVGERTESVTTDVAAAGYFVSDATELKTIVIPGSFAINWEDAASVKAAREAVSIKVNLTNNSFFTIEYVEGAEAGTPAAINNAEIDKLLKAYTAIDAANWDPTKLDGVFTYANNTQVNLNVKLYGDIFNTDATFNNINSLETWKAAVDMANWLKRSEQTFTLTGNVKFEGGVIPMPATCVVNAVFNEEGKRFEQKFYFTPGEGATEIVEYNEWPANLKSSVYVEVAEGVAFNAAHLMNDKKVQIVNNGIINIPEGTAEAHNTVSTGAYALINNATGVVKVAPYGEIGDLQNAGRVIVEYGAFVYPRTGEEGVIAYEVTNDDIDDPSRIAKLTAKVATGAQKNLASVNTLIVNAGLKEVLDFTKTTVTPGAGSDNDPYAPTTPGEDISSTTNFGDLSGVSLEINGAGVKSTSKEVTVYNVTMDGGSIDGSINIAGNLNVKNQGEVSVKAITGSVTTDGNVTATAIAGGIVKAENSVITVETIANGIKEAVGCTINATTSITGEIKATDCDITTPAINGSVVLNGGSIDATTINGAVTLDGETTVENAIITGDVTVNGNVTFENVKINGKLTVKAGATAEFDSEEYIYITEIVNNGTLVANNDIFVTNVTLNPKSVTTLSDNIAESDWNKVIYYTTTYNNDKMTLNGAVLKYTLASYDGSKTESENGKTLFDAINNAEEGEVVYAPAGNYTFDQQLNISKAVAIIGEEGTVINRADNERVLNIYLGVAKDVLLKNLTIVSNSTRANIWLRHQNPDGTGVVKEKTINITMENVTCKSAIVDNAYVDGSVINVDLIGCNIDEFTADGWGTHPSLGTTSYTNVTYDDESSVNIKKGGNAADNVTITKK